MISFPFDSIVTYDADGNPDFDRACDSEILSGYFHLIFTDGVFADPSTGLQVTSSTENMSVVVKPGNVNIQGHLGKETSERMLVFEASGNVYDRIDAVVARLNTNYDYRKIDLYVVKGKEASTPAAPELTRSGGIYELRLANVFIAKNTTIISAERITDTRLVSDDCGIVTSNPKGLDTTTLFEQYQAALAVFKAGREADFLEWQQTSKDKLATYQEQQQNVITDWITHLQGQLDGDVAAALQSQIDAIKYFYVRDVILYIPHTAASVAERKLILGIA